MPLQHGTGAPWTATAIHDTVAAIVRQAGYQRSISETLWQKVMALIGRWFGALFDAVRDSLFGRDVTIALLLLLALLIIARGIIAARAAPDEAVMGGRRARRAPGSDPWADAQRLAASGAYTDAAHALLAALLDDFASRGYVRLHSSKTAGDYARELTRIAAPPRYGFETFRRRYDRAVYGFASVDAATYEALLRDAQPLFVAEARAA